MIMLDIEIRKRGRTDLTHTTEWVKTKVLDTPFLRSKLCARPGCMRYVPTKGRGHKGKKYCSRECMQKRNVEKK